MTAYYRMETVEHFAKISLITELLGRQVLLSGSEVDKLLTARRSYFGSSAPAIERTDVCPVTDGSRDVPPKTTVSREDLQAMVERAVQSLKPRM
jgi:L-fuculose-phosphate aldolase